MVTRRHGDDGRHVPEIGDAEYEEHKRLARAEDLGVRLALAGRGDVRPEILYFLAEDESPEVRRVVAENKATPRHADLLLAGDHADDVRTTLVDKIARLAPGMSQDQTGRIERLTVEVLTVLARDQLTRVRRVLAEALKDVAHAPPEVVRRLAEDTEIEVAGPVLRYSPLLADEDLITIIEAGRASGVAAAIAERRGLTAGVADAVVATDDRRAITRLLANSSAQIREETLDRLVERAPAIAEWHEPLVRRPRLTLRAAARLASFVADTLLDELRQRRDLDRATTEAVAASVRQRLAEPAPGGPLDVPLPAPSPSPPMQPWEEQNQRAEILNAEGQLHEATIADAVAKGNREFVTAALARMTGFSDGVVGQILSGHSPKAVAALAWKAKLSMRTAYQIQIRVAGIAPSAAVKAREDGTFPMSLDELEWQVELIEGLGPRPAA